MNKKIKVSDVFKDKFPTFPKYGGNFIFDKNRNLVSSFHDTLYKLNKEGIAHNFSSADEASRAAYRAWRDQNNKHAI